MGFLANLFSDMVFEPPFVAGFIVQQRVYHFTGYPSRKPFL